MDGKRFRTETTLLPHTTTIEWNGRPVEALESQYVAYSTGGCTRSPSTATRGPTTARSGTSARDVFNYEDGVVADTDGTWEAGREGPAAMIMPVRPEVGMAFRPENAPGAVLRRSSSSASARASPARAGR